MNRRNFISSSCKVCAGIAGLSGISLLLNSCSSLTVFKTAADNKIVRVPVSSFLPEEKTKIVRVNSLSYDILLVKKNAGEYSSIEMVCTHFSNNLVANKTGLVCNLHGSTFNTEGAVTNGPAVNPLKRYPTSVEGDQIIINIS